jgi:hypothetical protein
MTKEEQQTLKHCQIQARAGWKLVDALCAVYGIDNRWEDDDSFFSKLRRECFDQAKKDIDR